MPVLMDATALQTAFSTGLSQIQTDTMANITTALPYALAIVGVFIATKMGIRFFKSVAK